MQLRFENLLEEAVQLDEAWHGHIDGDQTYVAVERRDNPALVGKPAIVKYDGMVAAASYEVRPFGIRAGMRLKDAQALARQHHIPMVTLRARMRRYEEISDIIMRIIREEAPQMEWYSIDEAFTLFPDGNTADARHIHRIIRERVRKEAGITVSAGDAYSKFAAKMLTRTFKPDRLESCISPDVFAAFFHTLDVDNLHDVGPKYAEKLRELGIATIGDLASAPYGLLRNKFTHHASQGLLDRANGAYHWKFTPLGIQMLTLPGSRGFSQAVDARHRWDRRNLQDTLHQLTGHLSYAMQRQRVKGVVVSVGVRQGESGGPTHSHQATLGRAIREHTPLCYIATELLKPLYQQAWQERMPINRIYLRVGSLKRDKELSG